MLTVPPVDKSVGKPVSKSVVLSLLKKHTVKADRISTDTKRIAIGRVRADSSV